MAIKRFTRQRRAVLEVLRSTRRHPDAAWIYHEVKKRVPSISLGTVYRTLDALVREGMVIALHTGGPTRYDAFTEPHPHLVCRRCGAVLDLDLEVGGLVEAARSSHPELVVERAWLAFEGLCPDCARSLTS